MRPKHFFLVLMMYCLLASAPFHFVYKFGMPDWTASDFFQYYNLYKNWDIDHTEAPFDMRLLSSFFVHVFYKAGIHYNTLTAFDKSPLDKQVFFDAIFFNYLCIVSTCTVIFYTTLKYLKDWLLSFSAGLVYLLGFGTLFYEFMPLTDALSVLLFALVLYAYMSRKYWVLALLALLIIQREYIFMALGLICVLDYWKFRKKYYLHVLLACIACFAIYCVLRETVFYTAFYNYQTSPSHFLYSVWHFKFPSGDYIRRTLATLNVFILYLLVVVYKRVKRTQIDTFNLVKLLLLFAQVNFISLTAVAMGDTGRFFYLLVPIVIFQLMKEVQPLIGEKVPGEMR